MKKLLLLLPFVASACGLLGVVGPAHGQAARTWVSGVGDDANPCSRTAPCKTFAGAVSKTAALGEINCIDPGGFGSLTITKSITIDCHEVFASILNAGTNGILINFDSFTDARKTVRIRNVNFNGVDTGLNGIRIIGTGTKSAGSAVIIEDCVIDGNFGGTARGISDERSGGGELYVADTTVRNTGATGINILPPTGTPIQAILDNVRVDNANFGVAVGRGVRLTINRSNFSGNTVAGIEADTGSVVNVGNSSVSGNAIGVQGGGGTIRLSNTDVSLNGTGIAGATQSFGNNRIAGNTSAGTPPTLIGTTSNPSGQQ